MSHPDSEAALHTPAGVSSQLQSSPPRGYNATDAPPTYEEATDPKVDGSLANIERTHLLSMPFFFLINALRKLPKRPICCGKGGGTGEYQAHHIEVLAAPPTYDSLYGELRQVRTPRGFLYTIRKIFGFILGTVAAVILIGVFSVIPIVMIAIGSIYVHDCPAERYIPIYLIVAGVFGLFKSITNFYYRWRQKREQAETGVQAQPEANVNPNPWDGILNCFLLAWFVAGSVWVYRTTPSFDPKQTAIYCNHLLYYFAFWIITVQYIALLCFVFVMCCCGCLARSCERMPYGNIFHFEQLTPWSIVDNDSSMDDEKMHIPY